MGINIHSLKCPNCGANVENEDGLDTFFCKYCGSKIMIEGQSDAAYTAKAKIKGMEHDEYIIDKKYEYERYKIEQKNKTEHSKYKSKIIITIILVVGIVSLYGIILGVPKMKSNNQEKELQQLVNEIMIEIENENFDSAYIKAQSIKYTENWSSEIEKKWDSIRKEVINQIINKEKEVNGKATHKPEKNGLFDALFK